MRQLLIGDCHFGTGSNSVVWLQNQLNFFNTQFIDILNTKSIDRVVFLGDLFDIRYSTNQQIGIEVKKIFRNFIQKYPNIEFYFIAGNHDFYSPLEEFHSYNSYDLVFGEEFEQNYPNVKFIVYGEYYDKKTGNLYLPWYSTEEFSTFESIMFRLREENFKVTNIFCHADLHAWDTPYKTLLDANTQVWSGHIHFIWESGNFHNIGAMFYFNFADVNCSRYMYIIDENACVEKIENTTTPKFKRYKNEEIFDLNEEDFKNAYVQLYVFNSYINKALYIERIKEIKTLYADYNVRIQTIDDSLGETFELTYFNTNIENYISDNIPEYLSEKYELIKDKVKNKPVY